MNPLIELLKYGQSVWYDNISRSLIKNNELKRLIEKDGMRGLTSNPTIFQKAVGSGSDYDIQLKELLESDPEMNARRLFEAAALKDIQDAADLMSGIYTESGGTDGFVSIEVSPDYAYNTKATIDEAARLHAKAGKPNVMIKIPATAEGIPAIKEMISRGVNVNVTLIFSPKVYEDVVDAYIRGLEARMEKGEDLSHVNSVASFFISRIDTVVDKELEKLGRKDLQGKTAIANARLVYKKSKEIFGSERFKKLKSKGAKVQRLLWASTGTKNPAYSDVLYVDELIGEQTVNTMPPATIDSFRDHGKPAYTIEKDLDKAEKHMAEIASLGINFEDVTAKLTADGVESFTESFRSLIETIEGKKQEILSKIVADVSFSLPPFINQKYRKRLDMWENENIAERLWRRDFTIWKEHKKDDNELSNRLGWLDLPSIMQNAAGKIKDFASEARKDFDEVVLLGMGGSSLAPEVFFRTFAKKDGYPTLKVLDSTHPDAVRRIIESANLSRTLFIVSSKSGTTVETSSFMHTALAAVSKIKKDPGSNFVAITDPGTVLESFAKEKNFRKIFSSPAEVGGRYSALTFFGLVPAALIGVDIEILLTRAFHMMNDCKENKNIKTNNAYKLGAALGELADAGRDKLIFISSESLLSFPDWIEQLIAESTGKEGKGILPVIEEKVMPPEKYGSDASIVYLRLRKDDNAEKDRQIEDIRASGLPLIYINLEDEYDLGKEFFRWEIATALCGSVLRINPFDQPNVQLAKSLAGDAMNDYKKSGKLSSDKPSYSENGISVFADNPVSSIEDALLHVISKAGEGAYISILAFINPSEEAKNAIRGFKEVLTRKHGVVVTTGFGPRFLHSTGQLHKGDGNKGLFIQFTSDISNDIDIPDQGYSFGTLISAQAQGDFKALQNLGRKIVRFHFEGSPADGIKKLLNSV